MFCSDLNEVGDKAVTDLAEATRQSLVEGMAQSIAKLKSGYPDSCFEDIKVSGCGSFLAEELILQSLPSSETRSVKILSNDQVESQTAPALAVAVKRQLVFEEQAVGLNG